jgi:hypothetical protein
MDHLPILVHEAVRELVLDAGRDYQPRLHSSTMT